jgi:hypothetical protein
VGLVDGICVSVLSGEAVALVWVGLASPLSKCVLPFWEGLGVGLAGDLPQAATINSNRQPRHAAVFRKSCFLRFIMKSIFFFFSFVNSSFEILCALGVKSILFFA